MENTVSFLTYCEYAELNGKWTIIPRGSNSIKLVVDQQITSFAKELGLKNGDFSRKDIQDWDQRYKNKRIRTVTVDKSLLGRDGEIKRDIK